MHSMLEEFRGKRVLLVGDGQLLSHAAHRQLIASQVDVIGPVESCLEVMNVIDRQVVDAAILDIQLDAETAFSITDSLMRNGIPFVFATSESQANVPENARMLALGETPSFQAIALRLFGSRPH